MKKIYILLFVLVHSVAIMAQTNIGGSVYYNTQLPLSGSPYIVTSNLTIENGATLTIDAGVEVKFTSGKYLYVYGNIVADQTTFTSNNATPVIGDWGYIQIGNSTYQGTGTFDNCTFEYAQKIYIESGTASFTGCLVNKMYYQGIESYGNVTLTNTTVNLLGCYSSSSYGYGVYAYANSQSTISGCNFSNCYRGLYGTGTWQVNNTSFQNCTYGVRTSAAVTGTGVTINNCTQDGFYIESGGSVNLSTVSITNCTKNGITMNTGGSFTANDIVISGCEQYGIIMPEGTTTNLTNSEISTCLYPIYYTGAGALAISGICNIHDNTNNTAYVGFGSLYSDWTLPDLNPSNPANLNLYIPYYFYYDFTVNESAKLTISSNCVLKAGLNTGLNIKGKFLAIADAGEYIYFTSIKDDNWGGDTNKDGTSTSPAVNNWQGIVFQNESNDAECVMTRCKVRYGSYSNKGGINCYNASPTINSCEITNNYFGFYLKNVSNPAISNTTIGSCQMTPVALSFEANPVFSNNILSSSDNQYDAIGILDGDLVADAVLPVRTVTNIENMTYLLLGVVRVPQNLTLTIQPGVVIKSTNEYHYLLVDGKIVMDGTAENPIVMTSVKDDTYGNPHDTNKDGSLTSPAISDWGGILMRETSSSLSIFDYCIFKYAEFQYINDNGYQYYDGCLLLRNTSPTITNCQFGNVVHGIMAKFASNPVISNCSFTNTTSTPIAMSLTANPAFSGNNFYNTALNGLGLLGETVSFGGTLLKKDVAGYQNISYVVLSDISISAGTEVVIDTGVVIKFTSGADITVDGGLKAVGSATQNIVFTSIHDDNVGSPADLNNNGNATIPAAGNWGMVKFTGTSNDDFCLLDYCNFRYGSSGTVSFENASGTLQNSKIETASSHGLICNGNAEPLLDNVIFQSCTSAPVGMSLLSNPQFSNITFLSNGYTGIRITDVTLSSNATLNKRSIAGIENVAYLIDKSLTVGQNAILTINNGVVIKFVYYSGSYPSYKGKIIVNGAFKAIGTSEEPIYFSSDRDDSVGGDSNNDGNTTVPGKGDWYCLEINSSSLSFENDFFNTNIRYGGFYHDAYDNYSYRMKCGIIRIINSYANIENCVIEQSQTCGIGVFGLSNPMITSCIFKNISLTPINMSMFSNPQFSQNTISNVGIAALGIPIEDWSVDAIVPKRNFAGYDNMTYYLFAYVTNVLTTITNGTTITIPDGVVIKFADYYGYKNLQVNGKLVCNGTIENPIVLTTVTDDNYGNPMDTNGDGSATTPAILTSYSWIDINDVSNDESLLNHVIFRYQNDGVALNNASPTIKNCTFAYDNFGIRLSGVSEPVIDSCTFDNLKYAPLKLSLVSYPSSTLGNIISGTTYKALGVVGETLNQEITLPKRDFAGITGIPYYFHETYTIGTSGGMTVEPGVIMKFNYGINFNVKNYLTAEGGNDLHEKIIFTDIRDDFYGGDNNSDSTISTPGTTTNTPWRGIYFENEAFDNLCNLDNCIVRYAGNHSSGVTYYKAGINLTSASPTITNTCIYNNAKGITASGASNPLVNNCDFSNQLSYALENVNLAFTINAENCWWGKNSGPTHSGNPGGTGGLVTNGVDYLPFKTDGATIPITGDVSLNGNIQAYDAALVLQSAVGSITLNDRQLSAADVSGNGTVTAYDASLILQYVIGFINYFPVWDRSPQPATKDGGASLLVDGKTVKPGEAIKIAVWVNEVNNLHSSDVVLKYDTKYLRFKDVRLNNEINALYAATEDQIKIGFASSEALNNNFRLATLEFMVTNQVFSQAITEIKIEQFLADEINSTASCTNGIINIIKTQEEPPSPGISGSDAFECYPNPFNQELTVEYQVNSDFTTVKIEVLDLSGKIVKTLANTGQQQGFYQLKWNGQDNFGIQVKNGLYLVRLMTNENVLVKKVHFTK